MRKFWFVLIGLAILQLMAFSADCAPKTIQIVGKVAAIGHTPFVKMAIQDIKSKTLYIIDGSLLNEIKNLQGVTIKAKGTIYENVSSYRTKILEVSKYRIVTVGEGVNRQTPWVGVLTSQTNLQLKTDSGKIITLEGPLVETLTAHCNSKVWLTGTIRSTGIFFWKNRILNPTAFGIIRPK